MVFSMSRNSTEQQFPLYANANIYMYAFKRKTAFNVLSLAYHAHTQCNIIQECYAFKTPHVHSHDICTSHGMLTQTYTCMHSSQKMHSTYFHLSLASSRFLLPLVFCAMASPRPFQYWCLGCIIILSSCKSVHVYVQCVYLCNVLENITSIISLHFAPLASCET